MNRIEIENKELCVGCNACGDICPKKAIQFKVDDEGFSYPVVDEAVCVDCGLCRNTCPVIHADFIKAQNQQAEPEAFAGVNKDLQIRFDSTSGGVFSALANAVFQDGGFVGGAVWDEGFSISHLLTNNNDDLPRLRSSKYAQSNASGFYNAVKNALKTEKKVLICGTPCQMAAMRKFLGKSYSNLFVIDFICRGINSPKIFAEYLKMFETQQGCKVVSIKQKNKELGWRRLTTKLTFEDGSVIYDPRETSLYMRGYLNANMYCRPSCYNCQFKGFPRPADITLADCWGAVNSLNKNLDNDLGTSLIMVNTEHGRAALEWILPMIDIAPLSLPDVIAGNGMLLHSLSKPRMNRAHYFKLLTTEGFKVASHYLLGAPVQTRWKHYARALVRTARNLLMAKTNIFKVIRVNGLLNILLGKPFLQLVGKVVFEKNKTATINISGHGRIGGSLFKHSSLESRFLLCSESVVDFKGASISSGCDIEVFQNAHLTIGPEVYMNIGATIICSEQIMLGRGVTLGRNVTIRDTHGGHFINKSDFVTNSPVEIGDHVWLCDDVIVMPGVKIGAGAVIAARSLVTKDVPPNTLVAGCPARVIRKNVEWKR